MWGITPWRRLDDEDGEFYGVQCVHLPAAADADGKVWTRWRWDEQTGWWIVQRCTACYRADRAARWRRRHGQVEQLAPDELAY